MNAIILQTDARAVDEVITLALMSVEADGSKRVYRQTFESWRAWCEAQGYSALDLRPAHVVDFLGSQPTTKATRQRQLSALRKLAEKAHTWALLTAPEQARVFEALRALLNDMKPPAPTANVTERERRALSPAEADKLLRCWSGDSAANQRNRALIAVLLLTGIRRSEAAALRWSDVDFDNGVLIVRHGKGDKRRTVPVAGDFALDALRAWKLRQPMTYEHVFTPVERGGHVGKDRPLTGTDVYRVVKATEAAAGVTFKPHDCRRTFITEALATGAPLATVQAAAGHARGETTLHYAQAVDARQARKELKLRYG